MKRNMFIVVLATEQKKFIDSLGDIIKRSIPGKSNCF